MLAHIWACIGDFIFHNKWSGNLLLLEVYFEYYMHLNLPKIK